MGAARIDPYWQTPESWRLHEAVLDVRGRGLNPLPIRIRQMQEWQEREGPTLGPGLTIRRLREEGRRF